MDLCSGYHQIAVDEESSRLLVITIPSERFKMRVLAQGISSASDIFNLLTETSKNMDDLLVFGDSLLEVKDKVYNIGQN